MRTYTQEELKEILELHQKWLNDKGGIRANLSNDDLYGANLRNANLCSSDLRNANLYGANLKGANLKGANLLRTIGDMQFVKSFQFEKYMITYTDTILNIGCKSYTINEWGNFTNKEISVMDNGAVEWWTKWKPIIMQIIKMSPAESTYYGDPWSVGLGTTTIITGTPQCHLNDS